MVDNQIYINLKDNQVRMSSKKAINFPDLLQLLQTGILSSMNSILNSADEKIREDIKKDLYDMYNAAATSLLNHFAPDIEQRPNLTTQAILEAENAILEREYKKKVKDPTYASKLDL